MRKILALLIIASGIVLFTACSSEPKTIGGIYTSNDDPKFEMQIGNGEMTIDIVSDGTTALYWKGTAPTEYESEFASVADLHALDESLMGSQDYRKEFKVDGDTISFPFQIMGMKKIIEVTR